MSKIKKVTLADLDKNESWEKAVIVFTEGSFNRNYSEVERSYEILRNNKYFNPNMNGSSLFGHCLDGKDDDVRLDVYMDDSWDVEYCYIVE